MERIQALINQLKQLSDQQAEPQALISIVQQLQQALQRYQQAPKSLGTSKVAVLMPSNNLVTTELLEKYGPRTQAAEAPISAEHDREKQAEGQVAEPVAPVESVFEKRFDPMIETPTLSQQIQPKIELSATDIPSLNDHLRQSRTEVSDILKEAPVKDLRKAIGINDRFLFINELFRGDEAMYERSIKTINSFNIYAEAEFWIMRELKTKLGWNPDMPAVAQFDNLVRRRFV